MSKKGHVNIDILCNSHTFLPFLISSVLSKHMDSGNDKLLYRENGSGFCSSVIVIDPPILLNVLLRNAVFVILLQMCSLNIFTVFSKNNKFPLDV